MRPFLPHARSGLSAGINIDFPWHTITIALLSWQTKTKLDKQSNNYFHSPKQVPQTTETNGPQPRWPGKGSPVRPAGGTYPPSESAQWPREGLLAPTGSAGAAHTGLGHQGTVPGRKQFLQRAGLIPKVSPATGSPQAAPLPGGSPTLLGNPGPICSAHCRSGQLVERQGVGARE